MLQPKLSICIPTYNRSAYLDILLDSILLQATPFRKYLEIWVFDNHSTDHTLDILKKHKERYPDLKYSVHPKNQGSDFNICHCFKEARGEYVWIIGSDDALIEGALKIILNFINQKNYDLIYVNSMGYDHIYPKTNSIFSVKSKEMHSKVQFTKKVGILLTFISGNIINRAKYLKLASLDAVDTYQGSYFAQLKWTYTLLKGGENFLYIKTPLIISKQNNSGGFKFFEAFSKNLAFITQQELQTAPKLRQIILNDIIIHFLPFYVLNYRLSTPYLKNAFTKEDGVPALLINALSDQKAFWFFIYPLLTFPLLLIKPWYFFIRITRKWGYKTIQKLLV